MSHRPINHSDDLSRLREEGYSIHIVGGYVVMRDVPFVDAEGRIGTGAIASVPKLAGDKIVGATDHTVLFAGGTPHDISGKPVQSHSNVSIGLGNGFVAKLKYSRKPPGGYKDYRHLMTTYAALFAGPAQAIDPNSNPRVYRTPPDDADYVFNYLDTASSRAEIEDIVQRLAGERVAIIGLGGTGSYILDFVSKTPVQEIRTFDADIYYTHNAFRSPAPPTIEELREAPLKVYRHAETYGKMHRRIVPHPVMLDESNVHLLEGITFAFVTIDKAPAKRAIVRKLEEMNVAFIDCGMGVVLSEGALGGLVRTTTSTPENREHVHDRVPFAETEEDVYASNIQIAELNALNAVSAVLKWKKLRGVYHDSKHEMHSLFTISSNSITNAETPSKAEDS